MNKKVLALIISAVLALVLIVVAATAIIKGFDSKKGGANTSAVSQSSSEAKEESSSESLKKGKLTLGDDRAKVGETVEIPISIKRNPGMWGGQIILKYDTEKLEYVDFSAGEVFDECDVNAKADGTVYCVANSSAAQDVNNNGTIVTLKFIPKPEAKGKTVKIEILENTNFTNLEEVLIEPEIQSGEVTIE